MLATRNLTKRFGSLTAVEDLSLEIPDGAVFGFLGHNGAGKTTTMRMLTTLLVPTSGTAELSGYDIVRDNLKARRLLGYLPENVALYGDLTTAENLRYFGRLSGVVDVEHRINTVLDLLDFSHWKDERVGSFSKGMRQRVGIAQALLHKPLVLFLDEPTSGLDPQGKRDIRELLLKVNRESGTTIFMNTHLLSEVTRICTHIGIIGGGRLLLSDTLANVQRKFHNLKSLEEIYFAIEETVNRGASLDGSH